MNVTTKTNPTILRIRVVAIICVVVHHTLRIYTTTGDLCSEPVHTILTGLSVFTKMCGLSLFTFISGFLVNYGAKQSNISTFISKKTKRLLIPALLWGALYYVFFPQHIDSIFFPSFINGTHLWYLPMLFLCMLVIAPYKFSSKYGLVYMIALFIGIFFIRNVNRTFAEFISYFPIFLFGYFFERFAYLTMTKRGRQILTVCVVAACIFAFILYSGGTLYIDNKYICTLAFMLSNTFKYIAIGIVSYLILSLFERVPSKPSQTINNCAFTIYILHCIVIFSFIEIVPAPILRDYWLLIIPTIVMACIILPISAKKHTNLLLP